MIGFHAVPLLLMGMLLTAIVLIMRATPKEPPKPLTRKQLKHLARREVDRYAKKHRNS